MDWIKIGAVLVASFAGYAVFSVADRTIGGGGRRSLAFAAVFGLALAFWNVGERGFAVMALAWALWRSLPWSIGGTTTPRTTAQQVACWVRNMIPALACYGWGMWQRDLVAMGAALLLIVWAAVATGLSTGYAKSVDRYAAMGIYEPAWMNERVELLRGQTFGAAFFLLGALWAVAQVLT